MVGNKGVGGSLPAKGGHWTVSGNERNLVAEREQLFPDRANQCCVVALWKIRASDRAMEQHVTYQRQTGFLVVKNHMSRCVAGGEGLPGSGYPR